jgi:drug/metabolite transporter (DMT)-like permease
VIETGATYGLMAAIGFGVSDVTGTVASRRAGAVFAAIGIQATLVVTYSLLLLGTGTRLPEDPRLFGQLAVVGVLAGFAYLATYQAFRLGPVTVTGPVVSTLGGMTVLLAVLVLGERPSPVQGLGVAAATIGMVLLGISVDGQARRARFVGPGVIFALVAMVLWASVTVGMTAPIREAGWLQAIATSRIVGGITLCSLVALATGMVRLRAARVGAKGGGIVDGAVSATVGDGGAGAAVATVAGRTAGAGSSLPAVVGRPAAAGLGGRTLALVLFMGLCDTFGFSVMSAGLEGSDAWLVGILSSFGPSVTVLFGLAVLRERLRPPQWLGLALVFGSVVLIGAR